MSDYAPNTERTGLRELTMSQWHRESFPDDAKAIDIDLDGACARCGRPLYLWEVVRGGGAKSTFYIVALARLLTPPIVPVLLVRYWTCADGSLDRVCASFRHGGDGRVFDAAGLRDYLTGVRAAHRCSA